MIKLFSAITCARACTCDSSAYVDSPWWALLVMIGVFALCIIGTFWFLYYLTIK